jgi:hypothetical protein
VSQVAAAPPPGLLQVPVLQELLAQQICPEPPQAVQARAPPGPASPDAAQTRFVWHWLAAAPPQQACPEPPHATHVLLLQTAPLAVQVAAPPPNPPPSAAPPQQG